MPLRRIAVMAGLSLGLAACGATGSSAGSTTSVATTATPTAAAPTAAAPTTAAPTTAAPTTAVSTTAAPTRTTVPRRTTTTTTVPRSTTTTALPADPQPTDDAAATVFMNAWIAGNMATAEGVATARAVRHLFATPYAGEVINDRGCSDDFLPRVCSWGPYAGGTGTLYEISVRPAGANWYVTSVAVDPDS